MKCKICEKIIINKGSLSTHEKTCNKIQKYKKEIIHLYTKDFLSINKLSKKYNLGKDTICSILGNNKRTPSEACMISRSLYPESYIPSDESKLKMRESRLKYMKENPDKTAWRKSNMSYPERGIYDKIKKTKLDKKHMIIREYSIFPYFIDFAFINEKVALEIDGSQHLLEERMMKDKEKDKMLLSKGWRVIRVTAKEVSDNIDNVFNILSNFLQSEKIYENVGLLTNKEYNSNIQYECKICGGIKKSKKGKKCRKCYNLILHKERENKRPPYEKLLKEVEETNYSSVGRKYGVSDNSIRKWLKYYERNLK